MRWANLLAKLRNLLVLCPLSVLLMELVSGSLPLAASYTLARLLVRSSCQCPLALAFTSVHEASGSAHMVFRTPSGSLSKNTVFAMSSDLASLVNAMILSAILTGFSSANAANSSARLISSTVDNLKDCTNQAFSWSYTSSLGGCSSRSRMPSIVSALSATATGLNCVFLLVILLTRKFTSAWTNQALG